MAGYKGTASIKIAISRGEVHGVCSLLMSTITSGWREDYEFGNFRPIIQLSGRARIGSDIPPCRRLRGVGRGPAGACADLPCAGARQALRRAAKGIPAERRDALRAALLAAMQDPAFVAEAAKAQMAISPMSGEEVEAFIAQVIEGVAGDHRARQAGVFAVRLPAARSRGHAEIACG